jgi:hypothetical protein
VQQLRLAWQWAFVFADGAPVSAPRLTWHHTEFGRRSTCERYRVVHEGAGWSLLDADWNTIAVNYATIAAAQLRAEQHAERLAAIARQRRQESNR